jgi:hypothetical protein
MTSTEDPDEVARLRREVEQLRAKAASSEPDPAERRGRWRPLVAGILVAIVALLAPISVLATWARDEIEDTDRYVETITPLASDPAVQEAIANRVEQVVFSYLDVDAVTQEVVDAISAQGVPPRIATTLDAVTAPLAAGIRNFISERIEAVVQSDLFRTVWIEANRTAHAQMVAVLTGEQDGTVDVTTEGSVRVDLAALIGTVKQQLADQGFAIADRIPEVQATFTIIESENLADAQWLFALLDDVATWLPVFGLVLLAVAIFIARDRRRMVLAAGLAIAGSMLLLGTILNLARPFYLDAIPASMSADAAAAVYDTLVGFIRTALRAVAVVALTVAVVAWLSASSGAGASVRRGLVRGVDALRSGRSRAGLRTGRLGAALAEYRTSVRVAIVGAGAVLYLLQDHPTGATALVFVIVIVLLLVVAEVLATPATPPRKAAVAQPDADDGGD